MTERLLALLLAGALVAPQLGRASEGKLNNDGERQASVSEKLPLPRVHGGDKVGHGALA